MGFETGNLHECFRVEFDLLLFCHTRHYVPYIVCTECTESENSNLTFRGVDAVVSTPPSGPLKTCLSPLCTVWSKGWKAEKDEAWGGRGRPLWGSFFLGEKLLHLV